MMQTKLELGEFLCWKLYTVLYKRCSVRIVFHLEAGNNLGLIHLTVTFPSTLCRNIAQSAATVADVMLVITDREDAARISHAVFIFAAYFFALKMSPALAPVIVFVYEGFSNTIWDSF
jgi:hypothetical protein